MNGNLVRGPRYLDPATLDGVTSARLGGRGRSRDLFRAVGAAAILGAIALVVALGLGIVGTPWYHLVSVEGGSMAPTISRGDLIVVGAPPATLQPGMILELAVGDRVVTHRVVAVNPDGSFVTRGDANATNDIWHGEVVRVLGQYLGTVPWLGRVLTIGSQSGASFTDTSTGEMQMTVGPWPCEDTPDSVITDSLTIHGSVATSRFTVADGCSDVVVSLVSLQVSGSTAKTASVGRSAAVQGQATGQPAIFDSVTATLDAGPHLLQVDLPACTYEVRLLLGPTGQGGSDAASGTSASDGSTLDTVTGGVKACGGPGGQPTPSPTAAVSPTPQATTTADPTIEPSEAATPEPTATQDPTPTSAPTADPTPAPNPTPAPTPNPTPTTTPEPTPEPTETTAPAPEATDSQDRTATPTPTAAPTNSPDPTTTPTATDQGG